MPQSNFLSSQSLMLQHRLANIDPRARIADTVQIGAFTTIEADVEIGAGTWIGSNVVIFSGTRIGENCKIFPGAVLGAEPQDLKFGGESTLLEVGDNVIVRECCTLNRGTTATGKTQVGSNSLLMAYTHIAHDCIVGEHCVLANNATLAGHVELEDYVLLGGMVAIHQFTRIGAHAMLGGGTLLNKDVPPFVRIGHYPASFIGVNTIGLRRRGFDAQSVQAIKEIYHLLFVANNNRRKALQEIEEQLADSPYKKQILDFAKSSKNGLVKGLRQGSGTQQEG